MHSKTLFAALLVLPLAAAAQDPQFINPPGLSQPKGYTHVVVVPELESNLREVIATVLAQSVTLDYYDEDAQAILDRARPFLRLPVASGRNRAAVPSVTPPVTRRGWSGTVAAYLRRR